MLDYASFRTLYVGALRDSRWPTLSAFFAGNVDFCAKNKKWHTIYFDAAMTMLQRLRARCQTSHIGYASGVLPHLFNETLENLLKAGIVSPSAMDFIRD